MQETIFDKIIKGEMRSWIVWQDDKFIAFLTPFANTPGVTVVIPKINPGDYIFALDNQHYQEFLKATKTVANILEKAFNTPRVGLVFEGTEIPYVHAKLYPFHGSLAGETGVKTGETFFSETYPGYITTIDGEKMSDERLDTIQQQIIQAQG